MGIRLFPQLNVFPLLEHRHHPENLGGLFRSRDQLDHPGLCAPAIGGSIVFAIVLLGETGGLSGLTERVVNLSGIGAVLMLRWVWERINVQAEFAAMAIALIAGPILLWAFPHDDLEWIRLGTMVVVSTLGTILIPAGLGATRNCYRGLLVIPESFY